jgi:hypothetical protein
VVRQHGRGQQRHHVRQCRHLQHTGTFADANAFASTLSGAGTFVNTATFNKTANTITTIGSLFNNTGTVNVNAGTLLQAAAVRAAGLQHRERRDARIPQRQPHAQQHHDKRRRTFAVTTDYVGADAIVTLNGGTHTAQFLFGGSTLTGTDQVFQGKATWTGGTLTGAASTTFDNVLTISGANTKAITLGRVVNLNGTTTWTGNTAANNNAIQFHNGATINNNATFNDANPFASFIEHSTGSPHNFNNNGVYNKLSNTITTVDFGVPFNNTGTVNLNAGTFRPNGGGTSTGVFNIAAGATLNFIDGPSVLNNVTTQGAGTFLISSDNVGADAFVTINGGTHTTPFVLSGSGMGGNANVFQGLATWSGGSIAGAGTTTFNNDVTITGVNTKVISNGRVVNLNGTTTWSGNTAANNNAIQFWNGATLVNNGTFNDANAFASFLEHNVGGPHSFNNVGVYNKLSNTVTTVDLGVGLQQLGHAQHRRRNDALHLGHPGPHRHDPRGERRNLSARRGQHGRARCRRPAPPRCRLATSRSSATTTTPTSASATHSTRAPNVTGTGLIVAAGSPGAAQALNGASLPAARASPAARPQRRDAHDRQRARRDNLLGLGRATSVRSRQGTSAGFNVTSNAASAGVLAPLTGQVVRIANNFDNVGEQNMSIVLGAGAAAYQLAAGQLNTPSLNFGTVQVGQAVSSLLSVTNSTTGPAGFVED